MTRTVAEIFGKSTLREYPAPKKLTTNRAVGIELELEDAPAGLRDNLMRYWDIINDQSLRNNGVEFVFRAPLGGALIEEAIEELEQVLQVAGSLTCTDRTSMHVHVNVRDLTVTEVRAVLALYVGIESALYNFGGKARYDNIYCPGVQSALEQMSVMRQVMHNSIDYVHSWVKYTGINLHALIQLGTIEFRAHEGTRDTERILVWADILATLVEYCKGKTVDDIVAVCQQDNVLEEVFPPELAAALAADGVYAKHRKTNLLNQFDLVRPEISYEPERRSGEGGPASGDVESIINIIMEAVGERS